MNARDETARDRPRRGGKRSRARDGLTLVELLVVLAVLMILVALTLGGVRHAMSASRRAVCANNLRWLYQGVIAYTHDHRDNLPDARRVYSLHLEYTAPLDALAPYFDVPVPFYDEQGDVVTGQPWECVADRAHAAVHGSNYVYVPYELIMSANDVGVVSRLYHSRPSQALLWADIRGPHPGGPPSPVTGRAQDRQAARFDGAVGWWGDLEPRSY